MPAATPSTTERIAQEMHGWQGETLPGAVRTHARQLLMDTLLVAWAGAGASGMAGVRAWIRAEGGRADSTAWGFGDRLPAGSATFLNALSAAALDFDSLNRSVHPDCVVIPAALAIAERQHASGSQFLAAFVAGSELICRLARASVGESRGWSHSPTYGVFGAAIATAKLLEFEPDTMAMALGVCLSQVAGTQQANVEQVLTKRMQPALAARGGVFAALAAQAGVTGPRQAFEGRFGLWNMVQACDPQRLMAGLGQEFALLETGLKKYPVCACSHAAMESCDTLLRAHGIGADDIEEMEATISPFMHRLVGTPFEPSGNIEVTAQFSIQYALAAIALFRRLGIAELGEDAVLDPKIRALAHRVKVTIDPANTHNLAPATVRLRLRDGRVLAHTTLAMPGDMSSPLSDVDVETKLRACAAAGLRRLSDREVAALQSAVEGIEAMRDVSELTRLLVV